jgi:hypothetical protein
MAFAPMPLPDIAVVHDRYLALRRESHAAFGETLAGRLLLRLGFEATGIATAIAASVAGAATLCVDADAEVLRQGMRAGLCDFLVGNLDEALRILKNEIRRGLPVSVCLTADPKTCTESMAERGVQPDLLSLPETETPAGVQKMLERGARRLNNAAKPDTGTLLVCWSAETDAARTMPRIAAIAAEALQNTSTSARKRWLEVSPRYLGRAFGWRQCLRMTPSEAEAFAERVRLAIPAARIERQSEEAGSSP